jgi:hypothetical protein
MAATGLIGKEAYKMLVIKRIGEPPFRRVE